jgi:hypothetical protein
VATIFAGILLSWAVGGDAFDLLMSGALAPSSELLMILGSAAIGFTIVGLVKLQRIGARNYRIKRAVRPAWDDRLKQDQAVLAHQVKVGQAPVVPHYPDVVYSPGCSQCEHAKRQMEPRG